MLKCYFVKTDYIRFAIVSVGFISFGLATFKSSLIIHVKTEYLRTMTLQTANIKIIALQACHILQ